MAVSPFEFEPRRGYPLVASEFTNGTYKVFWAPTQTCEGNSYYLRGLYSYTTPSGWPVQGDPVIMPKMVLFEEFWTIGLQDPNAATSDDRNENWEAVYNALVTALADYDNVYVVKGCSWIGSWGTYSNSVPFITNRVSIQRNQQFIQWLVPRETTNFLGLNVLHVCLLRDPQGTIAANYDAFPSLVATDQALWNDTLDLFNGHAARIWQDSTGELADEDWTTGVSGTEPPEADSITLIQDWEADVPGLEYMGTINASSAASAAATIKAEVLSYFGLGS